MWGAIVTLALAGRFVFETSLVNVLPAPLSVMAALVPATVFIGLLTLTVRSTQPAALRDRVLAGVGGVLGFWLAPLMVAAVRKTDAPPGSEVLLVTTAAWALLLVVGALFARKERPSAVQLVGVVIGVIGAAAVLANWERPSSFSPFVRFPAEEATMLAAGALWVVATRILAPLVRRVGALRTAAWALVPAAAVSVLAATAIAPASFVAMRDSAAWPLLALNALAVAALAISWTQGLRTRPSHVMAAAFLLPAPVLSALSVVEQATRAFGPVPLLWNAVLWGTAVTVAGALLLVLGPAKAAVPAIPLHSMPV
jgi:drug/metabolite transporter (DMT)-like permease